MVPANAGCLVTTSCKDANHKTKICYQLLSITYTRKTGVSAVFEAPVCFSLSCFSLLPWHSLPPHRMLFLSFALGPNLSQSLYLLG